MSSITSYKTTAFKESQKFLVVDPSTQSPSLVLGSDLVSYITPMLNYVRADSTRLSAENTDYDVGTLVQTSGATSPGDNFAATYLVVEGGTGDFPMLNGNDLLVIRGDEFLREQLVQPVATYNNVAQMVADVSLLESRKARTLGYYTPGDGGGNDYEIVAGGTGTADGGSFIDLDNGLQAKGLFFGSVNVKQFGAKGDNINDDTSAINSSANYVSSQGGGTVHILPEVRYKLAGTVTVPSNVTLQGGGGQGATFLEATNDGFVAINLSGTGAQLRDLFLNCASASGANFGVEMNNNRQYIDRCKIFGYGKGLKVGGGIFVVSDLEVTGFSIGSGVGVEVNVPDTFAEVGEFRNLFVEGNASFRPAAALRLVQCAGIQINNGDLMQCVRGIQFASDSALSRGVSSIKCINVYFDSNTSFNVAFSGDNTNRVDLTACWCSSGQYGVILEDGSITRGLTLVGGEIYDNSVIGFQKRDAATLTDLQINGTKFAGNGEDCRLGSATNFTISSVQTGELGGFPASTAGFVIEPDCSDYMLVANNFHDITDNGSSKKRGYNKGLVTENFGKGAVSPDANGNFTIAHGLVSAPDYAALSLLGDTANEAVVQSLDATNIIGRLRNSTTNADVTTGTPTVGWYASVK